MNKFYRKSTIMILVIVAVLCLFGCEQVNSPVAPSLNKETKLLQPGTLSTLTSNLLNITLLPLPAGYGKNAKVSQTQFVTVAGGGSFTLTSSYETFLGLTCTRKVS